MNQISSTRISSGILVGALFVFAILLGNAQIASAQAYDVSWDTGSAWYDTSWDTGKFVYDTN